MEGCYALDADNVWDNIRFILKDAKLTRYVNMIPSMLRAHGYDRSEPPNEEFISRIERQFMAMCVANFYSSLGTFSLSFRTGSST